MRLRVETGGESLLLELSVNGSMVKYELGEQSGWASVEELTPGVFSVLLNNKSLLVNVDGGEAWVSGKRFEVSLADPRDRAANSRKAGADGPVEIRAQMPGKIIKVLALEGTPVMAGEGILVVEAMKMQNEVKAPKDGTVARIHVAEGATVSAGDPLVVVE